MRALFYIISVLIPIAGIILGIIYYVKPEPDLKRVGRNCIIIAVVVWAVAAIVALSVVFLVSIGSGGTT
jgi:hypothetical protein